MPIPVSMLTSISAATINARAMSLAPHNAQFGTGSASKSSCTCAVRSRQTSSPL